jgi:hypothetical protein
MFSSDFQTMTTKAIETRIQQLENHTARMMTAIKYDNHNYRNQTCTAALEMIGKRRERYEAEIAYNNEKIVMMQAELQSRA